MYTQILFAQGPSIATGAARATVYLAPKTSAGTWTVNTTYKVRNEAEVIEGGGSGSPLHLMLRTHFRVNKRGDVYVIPYNESSGSAVAADGYVSLTGTATSSGSLRVIVAGEEVDVAVAVGDTADAIGEKVEASVNAKSWLPVTASNTAGKVTFTAKVTGASQGDGTIGVISLRSQKSKAAGITVVMSGAYLGQGFGTAGVDGSTSELTNLQAALDTITATRYYYIVTSLSTSGALAALSNHIEAKSLPDPGLRSVGITGTSASLAAASALAVARNYERLQLVWQHKPESHMAEIIANVAAIRMKYEATDTAYNFDGFKGQDWLVKNTASDADYLDSNDLNDALVDGLTPVQSSTTGSFLVMSCTTRSKDASGLLDDRRAVETHRVSVADEVVDTHKVRHSNTYASFKLKDDEKLPNGDVNPNQVRLAKVLTPSQYRSWLTGLLREFETQGKLKNVDATIAGINVGIDPNNGGRLEVSYDLDVINLLHQTTVRVAEVSAG
jgi:phage tail sheath gpL-like